MDKAIDKGKLICLQFSVGDQLPNLNYKFLCLLFLRVAIWIEKMQAGWISFQIATLKKDKQRNL